MCENLKHSDELRSHLKELNVWKKIPEPKPNQNTISIPQEDAVASVIGCGSTFF